MRTKWLNLILKTSSKIQKIKDDLLVAHGFKSVFMVVWLILVALFFVLVSTPFTLLVKDDKQSLKVRNLLSLTFLLPITILWLVKLAFVVVFVFVLGYSWFDVTLKQEPENLEVIRVYEFKEDSTLAYPTEFSYELTSFPNLKLDIYGKNQMREADYVLVTLSAPEENYTRYLLEEIQDDNSWGITKSFGIQEIPSGKYYLRAATVDIDKNSQSVWGPVKEIDINKPIWFSTLQSLDLYLNILIILSVGLSVFLTLIII